MEGPGARLCSPEQGKARLWHRHGGQDGDGQWAGHRLELVGGDRENAGQGDSGGSWSRGSVTWAPRGG